MMGRADTPVRRILNYASDHFANDLPLVYVQTVVGRAASGQLEARGLYIGDDTECFERAAELSLKVNFEMLDQPLKKVVVYLDPNEFKSTWLGNKSIYRTRMAIADEGELIVLAPGVKEFGEDAEIDRLIRKYGYVGTPAVMKALAENPDLAANLSAANLTDAYFGHATLTGADLSGADLTSASLGGATAAGVDLSGADLTDASLNETTLRNALFSGALVNGADFSDTTDKGFSAQQLYSTATYQSGDLSGLRFVWQRSQWVGLQREGFDGCLTRPGHANGRGFQRGSCQRCRLWRRIHARTALLHCQLPEQ